MSDRFSRQVLAFGEPGQFRIAQSHAAIVGLGGLGSHVAQALAYLGVGQFTLIDPDQVEETNLNRLIGAMARDVGHPKVGVIGAAITSINADARVAMITQDVRSRRALSALRDASVVFGCVDNDGARLILTEFCCAYRKVYIDSATEILPPTGVSSLDFGGRVVVSVPGEFCLSCAGELAMEAAKADLEPSNVKQLRRAHGYGLPELGEAPAVVTLNGVIASIAATEFMVTTTELRAAVRKSTYKGMRGVVHVSADLRKPDCVNCGYLVGIGDEADIMRYVID